MYLYIIISIIIILSLVFLMFFYNPKKYITKTNITFNRNENLTCDTFIDQDKYDNIIRDIINTKIDKTLHKKEVSNMMNLANTEANKKLMRSLDLSNAIYIKTSLEVCGELNKNYPNLKCIGLTQDTRLPNKPSNIIGYNMCLNTKPETSTNKGGWFI
jgi:hypothetical protein